MRVLSIVFLSVFLISGENTKSASLMDVSSNEHSHDHSSNHVEELCAGVAPENNLWIPDTGLMMTGITEEVFNAVLDRIEEVFTDIIADAGGELEVERNWASGTVNAYAQRIGTTYRISMFGGLARHETVTAMGFATVACHELGHHIGGFPRKNNNSRWASTEGQSDYYATLKCMRLFMDGLTQEQMEMFDMVDLDVDPFAKNKCDSVFVSEFDREVCYQNAMAGKSLANLLATLGGDAEPQFDTPDGNVVGRTVESHPRGQCRMDTYFQGSLCDKGVFDDVDPDDPVPGACNRNEAYTYGLRPLCWFKPTL